MDHLKTVDKKTFIKELMDVFIDAKLFGYECVGGSHDTHNNVLILDMSKEVDGDFESLAIKLDLSKVGIEFGTHEFPEEDKDGIFTPVIKIE